MTDLELSKTLETILLLNDFLLLICHLHFEFVYAKYERVKHCRFSRTSVANCDDDISSFDNM